MAPPRHLNQRSSANFLQPPAADPLLISLLEFATALPISSRSEPSNEINRSRPRHSWGSHQEQAYSNMSGQVANDGSTIGQQLIGSSSNPRANHAWVHDLNSAYAERSANRYLFSSYVQETAAAAPSRLRGGEVFQYGETRKCSEEDKRGDEICIVCQDDLCDNDGDYKETIATLRCSHEYHLHCIESWLQRRNVCPLCKATVFPRWR